MNDSPDTLPVLDESTAARSDARQWTRFTPEEKHTFLIVEEEQFEAQITDESFDGVGVLVKQGIEVTVGDRVDLIYYGLPVHGIVRSAVLQEAKLRLGLQWISRSRPSRSRKPRHRTESDFFILAGLPVACRIVDQTGNKLIALLPDRTEIELAPEKIRVITRFQRLADLENDTVQLRMLAAIYQLGSIESPDELLRAVLNLEFAPNWD